MELPLFEVGVAFGLGGVMAGAIGWAWGSARARSRVEADLRDAEKRASAAGARAETLGDQARENEARANALEAARRLADSEKSAANARASELARSLVEQRALLDETKKQLGDTFQAMAASALHTSQEGFLALAGERLAPVRESLEKVDQQIRALERERGQAYGELTTQVKTLSVNHEKLRLETGNLVNALRAPHVRGRWGELQLRRVVEMAGMLESCDFDEQVSSRSEDGLLRPDMVVRLPSGRNIVIDAKTPLGAYLEAHEASNEDERAAKLKQHAAQVRTHIGKLAAKNYWDQFAVAPEVVVMFLPGETFYSVALEQMPGLIEEGFAQNVLIATPTTLLGLLRAVSAGWREERMAENAQRISEEGRRLHDRIAGLAEKLSELGRSLGQAVGAYNGTIATFDTRVLPSARNLAALDAKGKKDLPELEMIERRPIPPRKVDRTKPSPLTLALSPSSSSSSSPSPSSSPSSSPLALEGEG